MNNKINIREELNKIDNDTFNEYDLRNMYDSCEWTKEEKKKIVESFNDVKKLNIIISNKFLGIEEPVRIKKVLNESLKENLSYDELIDIADEWEKYKEKMGDSSASTALEFIETECADIYKTDEEKEEIFIYISSLEEKNESLKESAVENILDDSKDYTGKPFSDFLQDIDHRSRMYVEYKDYPGRVSGGSYMAHDVPWNFANCPIISVKIPEDSRFYGFKVVVDASNAPRGINENLND